MLGQWRDLTQTGMLVRMLEARLAVCEVNGSRLRVTRIAKQRAARQVMTRPVVAFIRAVQVEVSHPTGFSGIIGRMDGPMSR